MARQQQTPPPAKRIDNAPAVQADTPAAVALIRQHKKAIAALMPEGYTVGRLQALVWHAFKDTPRLNQCAPLSVLGCAMEAAKLGLEPNTTQQHCFLIPYGGECQFVIGYRGLLHLIRRGGEVSDAEATLVYSEEKFSMYRHPETLRWVVEHEPILGPVDRGYPVGGYSIAHFTDGRPPSARPHTQGDLDQIREFALAKAKNSDNPELPWNKWPDQMFLKTMLKRHAKTLPMPDPVRVAIDRDNEAEAGTQDTAAIVRQIIAEHHAIEAKTEDPEPGDMPAIDTTAQKHEGADHVAVGDPPEMDPQGTPPGRPPDDEGVPA